MWCNVRKPRKSCESFFENFISVQFFDISESLATNFEPIGAKFAFLECCEVCKLCKIWSFEKKCNSSKFCFAIYPNLGFADRIKYLKNFINISRIGTFLNIFFKGNFDTKFRKYNGWAKNKARVAWIQKVLLLCEIKFTALQYNPLLVLYTPANDLEAYGFHLGVFLYWDGKFLGLWPVKVSMNKGFIT